MSQSALTAIATVKPERKDQLVAVLQALQARIAAGEPGPLDVVGTVHFARYVLLDGGTRLLFTSVYDGTWEQYIDDFIDHAADAFDAVYSCCDEYPAGGARDREGFKEFVRAHELCPEVFYSAFPDQSVKQVHNALQVRQKATELLDALA